MTAFTLLIRNLDGSYSLGREALFPAPPELIEAGRLKKYLSIERSGWSADEFGYHILAKRHTGGSLYIYPGLTPTDGQRPRKTFGKVNSLFSKAQIEAYAERIAAETDDYQNNVDDEFNILVHDLRRLSGAIYHAAEEAKRYLDSGDLEEVRTRINNVVAAQSMLKLRTDLLDYTGSPEEYVDDTDVPIFKRVDKVIRCFRPFAATKKINISLKGNSFGSASGPDVFEIIPYVLLDNAIKYSPKNSDIAVDIRETDSKIVASVQSVGPRIEPDERTKIFSKGARGSHAAHSAIPGSGLGLHIAETLVQRFNGKLDVRTSEGMYVIDNIQMTDVTFTVEVPQSKAPERGFRRKVA